MGATPIHGNPMYIKKPEALEFWKTGDPYGCFSNFYKAQINIGNITFLTSEHFYQAHKAVTVLDFKKIIALESAKDAADEGRRIPMRPDWDVVKDDIMMTALRLKFTQHPDLAEILKNTGSIYLVEASPVDYYWGAGKNWSGKNMLGHLLMMLRDELKGNKGQQELFGGK